MVYIEWLRNANEWKPAMPIADGGDLPKTIVLMSSEIAGRLSLSEQTVKHHLTHIFDKLGVYSRVELVLFAVNHKLCGAPESISE